MKTAAKEMLKRGKRPRIIRNGRHISGAAIGMLGFCTSMAIDRHGHGPEWIEIVQIEIHLKNLPDKFRGKRIVHISAAALSGSTSSKPTSFCLRGTISPMTSTADSETRRWNLWPGSRISSGCMRAWVITITGPGGGPDQNIAVF